ncbi:hypothetical protein SETIT_6G168100v2 [Setaria italica]|uniref:Secreted protein n=1 Tax=Setaria italica TaxID=4555 RepID=A0A368RMA1_SETIT|nr:hypothetical protein SETIT_6G168100v2 [Setaria italica]
MNCWNEAILLLTLLVISWRRIPPIYRTIYVENGVCYLHQSSGWNIGKVVMVQQVCCNLPESRLSYSHRFLQSWLTKRPPDKPLGVVWCKRLLVRRFHNGNPVTDDIPEVV